MTVYIGVIRVDKRDIYQLKDRAREDLETLSMA